MSDQQQPKKPKNRGKGIYIRAYLNKDLAPEFEAHAKSKRRTPSQLNKQIILDWMASQRK